MLIKNNAPRLRYIGGEAVAPGETKEVPDHWINALKIEIESGECEVITPQAAPATEVAQIVETESSDELQADKPKRGRPAKTSE